MRRLCIGELTPELIMGRNIVLAPESYDAMLELQLYMNSIKCTMFKMPVIKKDLVDAITRIKFDIVRRPKDANEWYVRGRKIINFSSTTERKCINLVSFNEHWQSDISYYQEKGMEIDQVFLDISRAVRFNNILGELVASGCEYLEAQELALNRIIRNGDSIPLDYQRSEDKINDAIKELRSCGITVSRQSITNKDEMLSYVNSFKTTEIEKMLDILVSKNLELNLPFEELFDKLSDRISRVSVGNKNV